MEGGEEREDVWTEFSEATSYEGSRNGVESIFQVEGADVGSKFMIEVRPASTDIRPTRDPDAELEGSEGLTHSLLDLVEHHLRKNAVVAFSDSKRTKRDSVRFRDQDRARCSPKFEETTREEAIHSAVEKKKEGLDEAISALLVARDD